MQKSIVLKIGKLLINISEIYEVDAGDEQEARDKADMYLKNFNSIPIPDEYEVECLDEE